jgi:hypothetical protein
MPYSNDFIARGMASSTVATFVGGPHDGVVRDLCWRPVSVTFPVWGAPDVIYVRRGPGRYVFDADCG